MKLPDSRNTRPPCADKGSQPTEEHFEFWGDWPEKSFGRALFLLDRCRRDYLDRNLRPYGISAAHLPLLALLWDGHDGDTQGLIAEELRVDAATVTRGIQRLERLGLVRRERSRRDSRAYRVCLTEDGWNLAKPAKEASQGWADVLTEGWPEERRDDILEGLQQMLSRAEAACSSGRE